MVVGDMKRLTWMFVLGSVFAFACVASPVADGASSDEDEVLVLDTASYWRCHVTLRPVVYEPGLAFPLVSGRLA